MAKIINVLLVEDDFYSRNLMELLLRRDWRTRVIGEVGNPIELTNAIEGFKNSHVQVDLVILDTEISYEPSWLSDTLQVLAKQSPHPAILLTGVEPNIRVARLLSQPHVVGYVLKDEIRYSLPWAVSLASNKRLVITPGVSTTIERLNSAQVGTLILDGRKPIAALSELEEKRSRLVFVFSMERHEFADEEGISEDFSYGVVSSLYQKLGLNDVLEGDVDPSLYFGDHPAVLKHLKETFDFIRKTKSKKVKNKETLAFHLLTLPEIEEIY